MNFIGKLFLLSCISVSWAQGQTLRHAPDTPAFPRTPGAPQVDHPKLSLQPARSLAAPVLKTPNGVTPAACPEPTASLCGYIPVPLDREHPNGTQIQIYFELYPHTGGGTAESAILVNFGGPGVATTNAERDFAQFLFAPNLDVQLRRWVIASKNCCCTLPNELRGAADWRFASVSEGNPPTEGDN